MSQINTEDAARRLALAIIADIKQYRATKIATGADISDAIAEGRALFHARVIPSLHAIFESALHEASLRSASASAPPQPPKAPHHHTAAPTFQLRHAIRLLLLVGIGVGVGVYFAFGISGEEVGALPVPGTITLDLSPGDRLAFTADNEVLFHGTGKNDRPKGCMLTVTLLQEENEIASASCDLFQTSEHTNIAGSSSSSQREGMRHLRIGGQRLGCRLQSSSSGPVTLRATSNLDTCVPKNLGTTLHVFRESAEQ